MKKKIIGILAVVAVAVGAFFIVNDCCEEGAECCYEDSPCCTK